MRSETELDHYFESKPKDEDARHLRLMFFSAMLVGVFCGVGIVTVIIHADVVDSFLNTVFGASLIVIVLGACGVSWFVWWLNKKITG